MSIADLILILTLWSALGFIILLLIPYTRHASEICEVLNPKDIYENADVNWFGCVVLTIFYNVLCPIMTIGYWFYWLCTVGRT